MSENKLFTLGIEEEFQIIDPVSRQLKSHIQQLLDDGKMILKEHAKAEMHQSVVEVGSEICSNIKEAKNEVKTLRRQLRDVSAKHGLRIGASGTHPFSRWEDQDITDRPRYKEVVNEMQQVARANLIFGLHVHIGIDDKERAVHIMNAARYFVPHIFALSTNSPFWKGRNTGFKSYRAKVFERFPRTGLPDHFNSHGEFTTYTGLLVKTHCIEDASKIWWDIRPHAKYPTLEFRMCDVQLTVDDTIAIAALIQAVVAKLYKLIEKNLGFRLYRRLYINENKWRAARYGVEGKLIDFGKQIEVPTPELIDELLEFVDDVLDELDSREEIDHVHNILKMGTGAKRQLNVFEKNNDLKDVVDFIIEQTNKNID